MHCIVGLGNPKTRYSLTRHNIGFQIADTIVKTHGIAFRQGKGEFLFAKGRISENEVLIIKPQTYMNRSGIAVFQAQGYYRVPIERVLIVLDDLDLPFGTFRIKPSGSDAGNRGLRSIIRELNCEDIPRFRFGIRNRKTVANPSSYVLSKFTRKERVYLPQLVTRAEETVTAWVCEGIERAMNRYNGHHLSAPSA